MPVPVYMQHSSVDKSGAHACTLMAARCNRSEPGQLLSLAWARARATCLRDDFGQAAGEQTGQQSIMKFLTRDEGLGEGGELQRGGTMPNGCRPNLSVYTPPLAPGIMRTRAVQRPSRLAGGFNITHEQFLMVMGQRRPLDENDRGWRCDMCAWVQPQKAPFVQHQKERNESIAICEPNVFYAYHHCTGPGLSLYLRRARFRTGEPGSGALLAL